MLDRYNSTEFETIEIMATSGGLSCDDSDPRMGYYGMGPIPHLVWNGGSPMVGAGTDVVDGAPYDVVVQNMLANPTPVKLGISAFSFDNPGAFVTVDVELKGDLPNPANSVMRVAIVEDHLTYGGTEYENILRDILPDQALTIALDGESQQFTIDFVPNASWITGNLRLIAMVQDDVTKEVLQVCNSLATPDYSMRYFVAGDRIKIGAGLVTFGQSGLFNAGTQTDTYDVTLETGDLPAGWSASFAYDGADYTNLTMELAPDTNIPFQVSVNAPSQDEGVVTLRLHSRSRQFEDRLLSFKVINTDAKILLVDDDGAEQFESLYFGPAIEAAGESYATWDRGAALPTATAMSNFDMVVWMCGYAYPTVNAADRAALSAYLDGGGTLFLTGQDIGWELDDEGGEALDWYHDYLHANYIADDTNMLTLQGVSGDPITDRMTLSISGGDGANNQQYPSDIDPRDAAASVILKYDAQRNGGIKVDTGTYRLVYLSFGYEAIDNATDRAALMEGIINWLNPGAAGAGDGLPGLLTLRGNVPNPFNPMTKISFNVGSKSQVKLGIYDVAGHLVRVLNDGPLAAGEHTLNWDGRDGSGRALPSGTYFGRVQAGDQAQSVKMMLVR